MNFKDYLLVMSIATVAAWIAWLFVIVSIDPTRTSTLGMIFFYTTLGIAMIGTLSIAGAGIRTWAKKDELVSRHVIISLRQSILFSLLILGSLILLAQEFFTLWTASLLIIILALIELVFLSSKQNLPPQI